MMAVFCLFATGLLGVVVWKGPALRAYGFERENGTEDGVKIIAVDRSV